MAIPILPIIGAISSLATTSWEIYRAAMKVKDSRVKGPAQEALSKRIEELEAAQLEQARIISELSKDLEQFAEAVQREFEEQQKRQARLRWAMYVLGFVALLSAGICVWMRMGK